MNQLFCLAFVRIFYIRSIRGVLVTTFALGEFIGYLMAFILQNYFGFYAIPKFIVSVLVIFACLFVFFPESPLFLVKQNKIDVSDVFVFLNF